VYCCGKAEDTSGLSSVKDDNDALRLFPAELYRFSCVPAIKLLKNPLYVRSEQKYKTAGWL
jgi:hypothetical protein